jgi:RimJ/RimL family protein N-acetyltransferase
MISQNQMKEENNSQKIVFLKGKKVTLRPLDEKDIERCCRWINNPEVAIFMNGHWPKGLEAEKKWLAESSAKKDGFSLAIETLDGVHIGNMGVFDIHWTDGVATTGAMIGEKEYWGKGYGTDAKTQLLNYLFNTLNLRKICSRAYAFNERSIAYSLHCGYKEEGRQKKHVFRNGEFHDVVNLALFKEDWIPYWKKYLEEK